MRKHAAFWGTAAAIALTLSACGSGSDSADPAATGTGTEGDAPAAEGTTDLNVMLMPVADAAPVYIADKEGMFADHGVAVSTRFVQNGAAATAELMSGSGQIAYTSPVVVLMGQTRDVPLVMVCGSNAESTDPEKQLVALVAKADSGLDTGADFNGTTIAVNALKAANELTSRVEIQNMGGDPTTINFTALNTADMQGAVERGQVDAAVMTEPFLTPALASGMKIVASTQAPYTDEGTASAYMATRSFVEENPDAVAGFCDALTESSEFANENPDVVRETITEYTEIPAEAVASMRLPNYSTNLKRETMDALADAIVDQGFTETRPDVDAVLWER